MLRAAIDQPSQWGKNPCGVIFSLLGSPRPIGLSGSTCGVIAGDDTDGALAAIGSACWPPESAHAALHKELECAFPSDFTPPIWDKPSLHSFRARSALPNNPRSEDRRLGQNCISTGST